MDWIKVGLLKTVDDELASPRQWRPVMLHPLPHAGRRPELWDTYSWEKLEQRLRLAGSPHIALHLDLLGDDWAEPVNEVASAHGFQLGIENNLG